LKNFNKLNGNDQRYGNESAHQNEVTEKHQYAVTPKSELRPLNVIKKALIFLSENSIRNSGNNAKENLNNED
jgi:hypothetical protein